MSYKVVVSITPGTSKTVNIPNPSNVQGVKISNGTPFDLDVSGFGTQGILVIPAGTEYMLSAETENRGTITILGVNNNNINGTGVVNLNVYLIGDVVPKGTWPITIPTQTVQANVSTITSLVNINQSPGTQVIQIRETGSTGDNFAVLNDGTVTVQQFISSVLTTLFNIIPDSITPEVIIGTATGTVTINGTTGMQSTDVSGNFGVIGQSGNNLTFQTNLNFAGNVFNIVDSVGRIVFAVNSSGNLTIGNVTANTITINGTVHAIDNGASDYFTLDPTTGNDVLLSRIGKTAQVRGQLQVDQNLVTSAEVFINSGSLHFRNSQTLTRVFYGSGSGNGTVTHNAGLNPTGVAITYNTGAAQATSPAWNNASVNQINVFASAVAWTAFLYWS